MATRFYLPSSGSASISPSIDAGWEATHSLVRYKAVTTKISSTMTTIARTTDGSSADQDICFVQYVSNPIAPQTISAQTLKFQMRQLETATSGNLYTAIGVRVLSGDGGTVRGTILAVSRDNVELATSLTNRQFSATTSEVTSQDGDVIVIEVGFGGDPSPASARHNGSISIGDDSATDLGENDTDTAAYNPWVQFTNDITFQVPNALYSKDITFGVPTIDKPELVQNAIVSKDLFFGVPTIDKPTLGQGATYTDYQVSNGTVYLPFGCRSKIFADSNGNLYTFFKQVANGRNTCAYKSTNGGQTWAEVDSAGRPNGSGGTWGAIGSIAAFQVGSVIHVALFYQESTGRVAYCRFNTSDNATPDDWAVIDTVVYSFTASGGEVGLDIVAQSDGDLLIISNGQDERDYTGMESVIYHYSQNNGSSWTSDVTLSNTNADCIGGYAVVGASNKIHLMWKDEGSGFRYRHQSLSDVTGTPSAKESLSDNYTTADTPNYGFTHACYYDDDGAEKVFIGGISSTFYPYLMKVVNDGTPDGGYQIVNDTVFRSQFGTSSPHWTGHDLASYGKGLYYVYIDATNQDVWWTSNIDEAGWGTADKIKETTAEFIVCNTYERNGNYCLGIIWQVTTTYELRFTEIILGEVVTNNDIVAKDITNGTPTIDKSILVLTQAIISKDLYSGVPTIDKPILVLTQAIVSKDLYSGTPTIDKPTLAQLFGLVSKDLLGGVSVIDRSVLAQLFNLISKDLVGGTSAVDKAVLAQLFNLVSKDALFGVPTVDRSVLVQNAIIAKDATLGVPTVDKPTLTQTGVNECLAKDVYFGIPVVEKSSLVLVQGITAKDLPGAPATIDKPTIFVIQNVVAKDLTSTPATADKAVLGQLFNLTSKDTTLTSPTIEKPTLDQAGVNACVAKDITAGVPVVDKPNLTLVQALTSKDVAGTPPVVDKPTIAVAQAIVAKDVTAGIPVTDRATLAQLFGLTAGDVFGGIATVDKPTAGQTLALEAKDILGSPETIEEATLAQLFGLQSKDVLLAAPTIDKPMMLDETELWARDVTLGIPVLRVGDFAMWWNTPDARVVSINEEDRTYTILAEGRLYIVPFENRTLTVLDRS